MANDVVAGRFETDSRGKSSVHTREFTVNNATGIGPAILAIRAHSDCPNSVAVDNPSGGTYTLTGPEGRPAIKAAERAPASGIVTAKAPYVHEESRRRQKEGVQLSDVGDEHREYLFSGKTVTELHSISSSGFNLVGSFTSKTVVNGGEGFEIQRVKGGIKISKLFGPSEIDDTWVNTRRAMVHKKVNSDAFEFAAAKEALLTEFNVRKKESGNWLAEFTIETSENRTGQTVAGIPNVNFNGWDFIEVRRYKEEDTSENVYRDTAYEVIVHVVYESTSYATLLDPA